MKKSRFNLLWAFFQIPLIIGIPISIMLVKSPNEIWKEIFFVILAIAGLLGIIFQLMIFAGVYLPRDEGDKYRKFLLYALTLPIVNIWLLEGINVSANWFLGLEKGYEGFSHGFLMAGAFYVLVVAVGLIWRFIQIRLVP